MKLAVALVITCAALSSCGGENGGEDEAQPATSPPIVTTEPPVTTRTAAKPRGRPPTRQDVLGTWATIGERLIWVFTGNGRFAFDRVNLDAPYARGSWKLKGRELTLAVDTALGTGCVGEWGVRAGIVKGKDRRDDELEIVFLGEGCGRIAGTKMTLARIKA